jgi:hypothetical protein
MQSQYDLSIGKESEQYIKAKELEFNNLLEIANAYENKHQKNIKI